MLNYNHHSYQTTAKLVAVCSNQKEVTEKKLDKRQIPLVLDDGLPNFIMQFEEIMTSLTCENQQTFNQKTELNNYLVKLKKDYERFLQKYKSLNSHHPAITNPAIKTSQTMHKDVPTSKNSTTGSASIISVEAEPNELMATLNQMIPCISCRGSVERFYKQIIQRQWIQKRKVENLTLDPFVINYNGNIALKRNVLLCPMSIFKIFYINCPRLESIMNGILKNKKNNRRCHLHSLDAHKRRSANNWLSVWESLGDDECRKKALVIESSKLLVTLNDYLAKHKFCNDCKTKVIRAFNILTGEISSNKENGYNPELYEIFSQCKSIKSTLNRHIHVKNDKKIVASLITKAEIDMQGNRRELHAKTIDIAQDEMLTCVGIHLYERFQKIAQAMRHEEQTWQLLYYASVLTLKKCFELEFEKRQGFSDLELICAELLASDEHKLSRKQLKKNRKKLRKAQMTNESKSLMDYNSNEASPSKGSNLSQISSSDENEVKDDFKHDISIDIDAEIEEERIENVSLNNETNSTSFFSSLSPAYNNEKLCLECNQKDACSLQSDKECQCQSSCNSTASSVAHSVQTYTSFSSSASNYSVFSSIQDELDTCINNSHETKQDIDDSSYSHSQSLFCSCYDTVCTCSLFALSNTELTVDQSCDYITEEEKLEYQANKSVYLTRRLNRRELLVKQFKDLKLNAFKLRPRNVF